MQQGLEALCAPKSSTHLLALAPHSVVTSASRKTPFLLTAMTKLGEQAHLIATPAGPTFQVSRPLCLPARCVNNKQRSKDLFSLVCRTVVAKLPHSELCRASLRQGLQPLSCSCASGPWPSSWQWGFDSESE